MQPNNYIELFNIKKTYNAEVALDVEHLIIPLGGILSVIGYSGSGKSTFVNILSLIDTPDEIYSQEANAKKQPKIVFCFNQETFTVTYNDNKIRIVNQNGANSDPIWLRAHLFGYVFQKHYLHTNFTISQNISIPLILENKKLEEGNISHTLKQVNLQDSTTDKYPDQLSGGQAQRASILRGLVKKSAILVADEPTSSLDIANAHNVLKRLQGQYSTDNPNALLVWVTHDIHLIAKYADTILVLSGGKIKEEKIFPNPKEENTISSLFAHEPIAKEQHKQEREKQEHFSFNKVSLSLLDRVKYIYNYAYKELFYSPLKPTFDFKVGASSIVLTLLFLLFLFKIEHSMDTLLGHKLNHPAVNNFSVITRGGGLELEREDVAVIKKQFEGQIKSASPVYLAPIDIKDNVIEEGLLDIIEDEYIGGFRFVTFEKNDPVLISIIEQDNLLQNKTKALALLQGESKNQEQGNIHDNAIIIQKKVLEELQYPLDAKQVSIRLDNLEREIDIIVIDSLLPGNVDGIIPSGLYLRAYFGDNLTQKPSMSHIIVYPKDIRNTIALSKKISLVKKFAISNFYELKTKIQTILDISLTIDFFSTIFSISLVLLSISFIYLSLYRSIEKKRKEIGILLANGISKQYFYLFYIAQAWLYFLVTTTISFGVYILLIAPSIDQFIITSNYLRENYGALENIAPYLSLPVSDLAVVYLCYFIFITSLFTAIIYRFISQKPIELMREN